MSSWTVSIKFEPRDLWIGVYWEHIGYVTRIFVCILPTLPILFQRREEEDYA